jgi:hypothetical protein
MPWRSWQPTTSSVAAAGDAWCRVAAAGPGRVLLPADRLRPVAGDRRSTRSPTPRGSAASRSTGSASTTTTSSSSEGLASRDNLRRSAHAGLLVLRHEHPVRARAGPRRLLNQRSGAAPSGRCSSCPVILGVVVQGLMWKLFLLPAGRPCRRPAVRLVRGESEFLGGQPQAFAWVIVVQIWANVGITMVIFLAGMQTIPRSCTRPPGRRRQPVAALQATSPGRS